MEYLMKAQENQFRKLLEGIKQKQAERLVFHSKSYDHEIQNLRDSAKEHHEIFV